MTTINAMSRRALLAISAAAVAGTAAPLTASPVAAGAKGDALLIEAWTKYQAAMDLNATVNKQMEPMFKEVKALLPPTIGREEFLSLTEEAQEAYNRQRDEYWVEAFDKTGLTAAQKEQQHFLDTVADPLAETIRNTAPTTLQGVAIKAIYMLDYARPDVLSMRPETLGDEALCQFIDQLADLAAGEA